MVIKNVRDLPYRQSVNSNNQISDNTATKSVESKATEAATFSGASQTQDRSARVEQIKNQISSGTYKAPPSEEVAKAFLKELGGIL